MSIIKLINSSNTAEVDDEDFDRINAYEWRIGGRTIIRYVHRRKWVTMASQVMRREGVMYDHKDRNYFNNRKNNLRVCSYSQNAINAPKRAGCTSKYKGVYWNKQYNKWHAQVGKYGNRHHLGMFESEDEAALAYNKKAFELFGEFAVLNVTK